MIENERHALYVGWVLGLARRNGVPARPEVDEAGDYTDALMVEISPNVIVRLVVPPPPADWQLAEP